MTNLRAAAVQSLVRPQFADMVPYVRIDAGSTTASIGNPSLEATRALNLDLMLERYFSSIGYVSAGAFFKDISNFIFPTSRPRMAGEELGPDATTVVQPVNGP